MKGLLVWAIEVAIYIYQTAIDKLRVKVSISNSQILEWLTFRIWKLMNVQILNGQTYESIQYKMKIEKMKRLNSFISKGKYENRQNYE